MNSYNNNIIKNTPDFVYIPPERIQYQEQSKGFFDNYICKFKTAVYVSILFALLSLPLAYKMLDMIAKLISNKIELIDYECEEALPLGRLIMSIIVGIIVFII
jgi:membrane-bound acyltransferase YfiQ involved in biofilm formation